LNTRDLTPSCVAAIAALLGLYSAYTALAFRYVADRYSIAIVPALFRRFALTYGAALVLVSGVAVSTEWWADPIKNVRGVQAFGMVILAFVVVVIGGIHFWRRQNDPTYLIHRTPQRSPQARARALREILLNSVENTEPELARIVLDGLSEMPPSDRAELYSLLLDHDVKKAWFLTALCKRLPRLTGDECSRAEGLLLLLLDAARGQTGTLSDATREIMRKLASGTQPQWTQSQSRFTGAIAEVLWDPSTRPLAQLEGRREFLIGLRSIWNRCLDITAQEFSSPSISRFCQTLGRIAAGTKDAQVNELITDLVLTSETVPNRVSGTQLAVLIREMMPSLREPSPASIEALLHAGAALIRFGGPQEATALSQELEVLVDPASALSAVLLRPGAVPKPWLGLEAYEKFAKLIGLESSEYVRAFISGV
jgi:hypothetical protein